MKISLPGRGRSRHDAGDLPGLTGTVRADRRTAALLDRLRPGDIAILDQIDLDRTTADALVDRQVAAVVNASPFISGRYPNLGPEILAAAGVLLVDGVGNEVFSRVKDGARGRLHEGTLTVKEQPVAEGRALDEQLVAALMDDARSGMVAQLQSFTANATEFLRREQGLLLHGEGVPDLAVPIDGRPVVVVVRGLDYKADLKRLKRFIKEQKPVLIGVDAGADALLAAGHTPDLVVAGEHAFEHLGSGSVPVTDEALRAASEVILHVDEFGRTTGKERIERLGVRFIDLAAGGSSADVALLIADVAGASMVVTVGTHASLDELLDRQRAGQASTFLTRLRVGPKLVDARTVPHLYAGRVRAWHLFLVLLVGLVAVVTAIATTPVGQDWYDSIRDWLEGLF